MKKNKDLRDFLDRVRKAGVDYYVEVKKPLNPDLEFCVLQQKLAKRGRFPVLYCPVINGSKLPLVSDLFGSYEMLAMALDIDPKASDSNLDEPSYFAFNDRGQLKVDKARVLHEMMRRVADKKPPQEVAASEAPVKEVIIKGKDVDLGILPITKHGKLDSGKYITIGCMVSKDPDTGIPNVGVFRHEVKGKNKLGFMTNPAHHSGYIARRYAELDKPMEVAICIGHHPAVALGALAKGGLDMNEMEVMGGILGEPLQVTKAETVDLPVPASSEIVIEGVIDCRNMTTDGPFAEFTGYYGEEVSRPAYLIDVKAITMRKDAIYHDVDPAHPEHNLAPALFYESAVYDLVKRAVPTVKAVHFPLSGTCTYHIYVSIKKRLQGEGKMAAMAALVADQNAKMAIVVDDDIDVYDEQQVMWAVATRVIGHRDISMIPSVTGSDLEPSAYSESLLDRGHMSTKVIIDATMPVDTKFATRISPPEGLWKAMKFEDYI